MLLIDTNLLLLLIVGSESESLISAHGRLSAFTAREYSILVSAIAPFGRIVVTPTILAEVSNLLPDLRPPARDRVMAKFVEFTRVAEEVYVESRSLMNDRVFIRLGLADVSVLSLAVAGVVVLTADFNLYLEAETRGLQAINFNHLRDLD
jgi:hypothetical protein